MLCSVQPKVCDSLYIGILSHRPNRRYFLQFLFWTLLLCIASFIALVARFVSCSRRSRLCLSSMSTAGVVLSVICFVESIIFALFIIIMIYDQITAIFDNTPQIDQLQNRRGDKVSGLSPLSHSHTHSLPLSHIQGIEIRVAQTSVW